MAAITLRSSAGLLQGLHDPPETGPAPRGPLAAVICHPHPLGGGTMDNKVVYAVAKTLAARGVHVVRFNFRGAGGSEGAHDEGRGERDDVAAALDHAATCSGLRDDELVGRLLVVGYSFGSFVGLHQALDDDRVGARMAIAPPVNHYDYQAIGADPRPLAVVYAGQDELVPPEAVRGWIAGSVPDVMVTRVDDAGHLFHGRLAAIRTAVDGFVERLRNPAG